MKSYKYALLFIVIVMASFVVYTQLFMPSKKAFEKAKYNLAKVDQQKSLAKDSLSIEQANLDLLTAVRETKTQRVEEFKTDTGLFWLIHEIDKYNRLAQRAKELQLQ
ncbi:MAG TPA: hypothetical protein DCF84_06360 [Bacteroidetes bacterium]|nr:hypothetical protein [Bacteroidota bacterium]|tara:strand:+ start:318 stop:638 length:321 start_codon:yes stop_codon:yes gene_type:complete